MRPEVSGPWARTSQSFQGLLAGLAFWIGLLGAIPVWAQTPAPLVVQVNYDPAAVPGSPDYAETLANVVYPIGKGPLSQGFAAEPMPILIMFRGGNSNKFTVGDLTYDTQAAAAPLAGMIGVSCNYAVVGNNEDYRVAVASVARLVQYLRLNAAEFNLDPNRLFTVGRSFGTVVGYGLALKQDHRIPGSLDPLLQQSSRPTYYVPRFGPSQLTCFADDVGSWAPILNTFFFPGKVFSETTPAERLMESATWWLLNPELFNREYTPPLCVVFAQSYTDTCGTNIDVHSGLFGDLMLQSIESFARISGDQAFEARTGSIDLGLFPEPELAIVGWCAKRLADDFDGLWLLPPKGSIAGVGGAVSLSCHGAPPGATVFFFKGTQPGTFPMPGCPQLLGQILDWQTIGSSIAGAGGVASLSFAQQASLVGATNYFHCVDFDHCEMSNLVRHVYY